MTWWIELGYPPFEKGRDGFPCVGQVVKHYREQKKDRTGRTWSQKDLARHLEITEHTVQGIERGTVGIDHERRHFLSPLLDIPPILLGIVTLEEIERRVEQEKAARAVAPVVAASPEQEKIHWWIRLGYSAFAPGKDGFPRSGAVVKYYRERKMDHEGHPYTQSDLAQILGITEQSARYLENKDIGIDFERRQFLSKLLNIPPILLGVITLEQIRKIGEERGIPLTREPSQRVFVSGPLLTTHQLIIDTKEYHGFLVSSRSAHISRTAYSSMTDMLLRINSLYGELPHVRDKSQIQELLCEYHQFVADLLRDQQKYDDAILDLNKAFRFAKLLENDELKALVLHRRGRVLHEAGRIDLAIRDYEEARRYERGLPGNLNGPILLHAGLVGAKAAKTEEGKKKAIHLLDRGGNIIRTNRHEGNLYWVDFGLDRYYLNKGAALIAVDHNKDALNELKLVRHGPEYPRGQAENDILKAQAHANLGRYSEAVGLAESGFVVVQRINSAVNIARVEKICKQLKESPYKDSPDVARLDYLLYHKPQKQ